MMIRPRLAYLLLVTLLSACASFGQPQLAPGTPEADVMSALGAPTHRYRDGEDQLLEYMHGPWGQSTYMARIGPDGRLKSYEEVLATEKFALLKLGQSNKEDVLRTIGAPSDTSYFARTSLEVWSYPYKESGVWNSVMHVHFDNQGIVRQLLNTPDSRFDDRDSRFPFGFMSL